MGYILLSWFVISVIILLVGYKKEDSKEYFELSMIWPLVIFVMILCGVVLSFVILYDWYVRDKKSS